MGLWMTHLSQNKPNFLLKITTKPFLICASCNRLQNLEKYLFCYTVKYFYHRLPTSQKLCFTLCKNRLKKELTNLENIF
uniref:Uncharacterized protein n=1 Tax=Pyxicephalus adspersus TaxID=30357 RepID=A0AAV3AJN8_PYXAD|nr:TPA: hypothetical protein GDO54_009651 [Pyxicephalus adspersus]